jgi:hypothetical protein
LFQGRFVCEKSLIPRTFGDYSLKLCSFKWETLPQTNKKREHFPVEKTGNSEKYSTLKQAPAEISHAI